MSLTRKFYADPYMHTRQFVFGILIAAGLCGLLYLIHYPEFYAFRFVWWNLLLIPLGFYIGGLSVVFIHNATHGSFPGRFLNWTCGQLAGMHQLWGFTNWKHMHLVHHQYSDDPDMDPHPPKDDTFWQYARHTLAYSSAKINDRYFEHWGNTPRSRAIIGSNFIAFIVMNLLNLLFWYLLLGPVGFWFFYLPSYFASQFIFMHINYFGHPKDQGAARSRPGNLDHKLYYRLANTLWFGLYYHGNHHRRPMLFNPKKMPAPTA